ncbi:MAG: hypothetical protein CVU36_23515 [Betaproteobacteria bacterium HGW-Betaproteobacteria-9]|jgi:hypothetical protein|nr:MAG: hypothetical protein CVU36_23515 [Betaproteobacteria bacterium HGW-Betaproteobacteria-9]
MAEILTYDQAVAALQQLSNPSRDQLLDLAVRVSVSAPGDVTVLYSGPMGQNAWATPAANALGNVPGVRVIDNTDAFKFLDSRDFKTMLAQLDGVSFNTFVDRNYKSPTTEWLYSATEGPWAQSSARFVAAASGDVRTITPYAMDTRVFAATELPGLMDNPNVTHINGVDKGVYQALLDTGHSLSEVNQAVSASSYGLLHDAKVQFDADGHIAAIDAGHLFDGTNVDPPRLSVSDADYLQNVDGFFKGKDPVTNASTLDNISEGWRLLGEGATAHNLMTGTLKGVAVLGVVATTYEVYDMADRANKAYAEGDTAGAARILAEGTARMGGEWAGGLFAAETAATAFAPLLAAGPIGIAAYVLAVGGSGAAGAYAGGEAAEGLIRTIEGAQAIFAGDAELVFLPILENDGQINGWRAESTTVDENGNSYVLSSLFDADGNYARTEVRSYGPDGTYQGTSGVEQATESQLADRIWQAQCQQETGQFCVVVRGGGPNVEVLIEGNDERTNEGGETDATGGSDVSFESDDDASAIPASGSQIEIDGQTYTLNADGEYVQNLGQGQYDLYDNEWNRYLVDAQGNRTLVAEGDTITFDGDTGLASVAPVFVPPAPLAPQDSANGGQSLGELAAQLPPEQMQALLLSLANMGLSPEALGGVNIYTNPDGSRLITVDNGDGGWDTIGTMEETLDGSGWSHLQLNGIEDRYISPSGQAVSQAQYNAAQANDAAGALNVISSVIGLQNWSALNEVQRLSALATLYNQVDQLGVALNALNQPGVDVSQLPGNIGAEAGALSGLLSLVSGIENDSALQTLVGGIQLGNAVGTLAGLGENVVGNAIAESALGSALGVSAAQVVPVLNFIIALDNIEENPWGAVAAACACFPPVGTVVAVFINIAAMFVETDIPPSIGEAEVHVDASGAVVVNTTQDEEGGGGTAAQWADALAHLAVGAGMSTPQAGATAQHLPSVGYYFDPDGVNLSNSAGHLTLRWTDDNGQTHQRLYDSSGMRWDGNSVEGQSDIMRDYLLLCQSLEPNWPPVMYQEVAGGILQLDYGVATVLYATALGTFDGQAAHTQGGEEDSDGGEVLIDANSAQMLSLSGNTIQNHTGQPTQQTLGAQDIHTVPRIGASANGPQIPLGRDPIVFVPIQALPGGASQTVTAGMVSSLTQANLFSDAQLAATAMALGLTGMAFASQAAAQGADQGTEGVHEGLARPVGDGSYDWGNLTVPAGEAVNATPVQPGTWTDAQGQTVAPGGTVWPGTAAGAPADGPAGTEQRPELVSDPVPPSSGAPTTTSATLLPPGYGEHELGGVALLSAGDDLALDYPTVQGEQLEGTEDESLRFSAQDLLANDSTPNPVPKGSSGDYFNGLRIISVGEATHGQVGIHNGELVFIPDENYNGIASFSYTVQDMYGLTHTGTASILVQAVNDAPEARGESATGSEDAELLFTAASLLRNDTDIDGDSLRISQVGEATGGTVLLQADGSVRFVPTPNYNGPAGYAYWVSDGHEQVRAQVKLNILQVNDLPVVQGELVDSDEDVVLDFPFAVLLANDSDVDTDPDLNQAGVQTLTISAVGNAQHGSVAIIDGQVRFTPVLNYFGPASFDYLVDDGAGGQVSTTVILNLAPVNDAPDVAGESDTLAEDNAILYTQAALLANDSDVDNAHAELSITQVGGAQNGSVELLPDGRIRFVPDADYFGPAQFDYLVDDGVGGQSLATVTLEVTPVNDDPRLQGELASIDEDTVVTLQAVDLLSNDHDVDNDHADLVLTEVGGATHGAVSMDEQGRITFTPTANYYGQASFTYTVIDGVGGSSTATMVLDYQSVNDLPVVNDEVVSGKRGISYTFDDQALLANDTDVEHPGQLQIVAVGGALNGSVTMLPNGDVRFVPAGDYDSWNPSVYGSFEYTVRDPDGGESVAVVAIDYSHINLNPIAVNDSFQGYEDVRMEINVSQLLRNDSDPDASAWSSLQVLEVANAQHGSVSLSNGVVSFDPSRDYYGDASFQYRVSDGEGGSTWATAFIDIERENRAPVITGVNFFGGGDSTMYEAYFTHWDEGNVPTITGSHSQDDPHRVNGQINAYDPDGDTLTFSISPLHQPEHGTAYINEHVSYGAPYGLDHVQLQGGSNTVSIGTYNGSAETLNVPGVDPNTPYGGRHDYFVSDVRNTGSAYSAWQYISWKGDNYSGADSFVITVTDSRGLSTTSVISVTHVPWSGGGYFPVVVDVGSDGIDLLRPDESGRFADINGDGRRDQIGWVASTDALLAYDQNDDALINRHEEISFVGYQPGARTDLEGLAAFDTNGDGVLSAADDEWGRFGLLQDTNANGVQDAGEWQRLQDRGVASVGLHREGSAQLNNGNVVFGTTTLTYQDGSTQTAGDVMFAGNGVALPHWVQAELQSVDHPAEEVPQVAQINATSTAVDALMVSAGSDDSASVSEMPTEVSPELLAMSEPVETATESVPVPSIEQQANVFTQMQATQVEPTPALGYVDAQALSLSDEANNIIVLGDEPVLTTGTVSQSSAMAMPA